MSYKVSTYTTEEKIKLAGETSKDHLYEPKLKSRKKLRILTVIAYIFCVSLAAIMLSLYYVFLWDPSVNNAKPHVVNCVENCEKIVIPENLAIRLANSTEITVDTFFHNFYKRLHLIQVTEIPNMKKIRIKEISMRPHKKLKAMRNHKLLHPLPEPNPTINETGEDNDDTVTKSYEKFDFLVDDNNSHSQNIISQPSESPTDQDDDADNDTDYEQSGNGQIDGVASYLVRGTNMTDYDQDATD